MASNRPPPIAVTSLQIYHEQFVARSFYNPKELPLYLNQADSCSEINHQPSILSILPNLDKPKVKSFKLKVKKPVPNNGIDLQLA
jgi:hypothetical protein